MKILTTREKHFFTRVLAFDSNMVFKLNQKHYSRNFNIYYFTLSTHQTKSSFAFNVMFDKKIGLIRLNAMSFKEISKALDYLYTLHFVTYETKQEI